MSKYLNFTTKLIVDNGWKDFMGLLDKLKRMGSQTEKGEDFVEVTAEEEKSQVNVKIDTMTSYADAERILQFLREGYVVFLRIRELREKNINELKKAVEKIKKTANAMSGDMVGVDEDFLIITPKFARIYRGQPAEDAKQAR